MADCRAGPIRATMKTDRMTPRARPKAIGTAPAKAGAPTRHAATVRQW
jgi:hypothetical protein